MRVIMKILSHKGHELFYHTFVKAGSTMIARIFLLNVVTIM